MDSCVVKRSNPVSSIIASIPHGSSLLTPEMIQHKKPGTVLANNDWMLNELYSFLPALNVTTVSANYSRYVIDVNRDIRLTGDPQGYTKSLVYRKSTFGREIYDRPLSIDDIANRVQRIYLPYHNSLSEEISVAVEAHKKAYLVDLHSFYIQSQADVVLGTCHGRSCSEDFREMVRNTFETEGFSVEVDSDGLSGGYITATYGSWNKVESIQVELRYTTYIENRVFGEEEVTTRNVQLFKETQARLYVVFEKIKAWTS